MPHIPNNKEKPLNCQQQKFITKMYNGRLVIHFLKSMFSSSDVLPFLNYPYLSLHE